MSAIQSNISVVQNWLFATLALVAIGCLGLSAWTGQWAYAGVPFVLLVAYQTVVNFKVVFYFLLFCTPLSIEYYFPNGLSTDLPVEPLTVGLMLAFLFYVIKNGGTLSKKFFLHPISLGLAVHLIWMVVATIYSNQIMVSVKFALAKFWYVAVYFYMAGHFVKNKENIHLVYWLTVPMMTFGVLVTLATYYSYGFAFEKVNKSMDLFFRNHVSYAAIASVLFPFSIIGIYWQKKWTMPWLISIAMLVVILLGIQYSYTRAAYVSIILGFLVFVIIKMRLMKWAVLAGFLLLAWVGSSILNENKYLDYAPNFEKTVSHKEFGNLMEATVKMEDVSTMERVYRWVAGLKMSEKEQLFGYGPGNFYFFYKKFTIASFETYVSGNPEKSGIHSYYLMMLVDQGVLGALLFLAFMALILLQLEKVYHRTIDRDNRLIIMAASVSLLIILFFCLINDLIETPKAGAFFFINLAIVINIDRQNRLRMKEAENKK